MNLQIEIIGFPEHKYQILDSHSSVFVKDIQTVIDTKLKNSNDFRAFQEQLLFFHLNIKTCTSNVE